MSKDKTEAKATIPTEEDVRAARFWLQVQEEAERAGMSPTFYLNQIYQGPAYENYYKRGAAITIRYDLVLSPIFPNDDKEAADQYQALYAKVVSGPLIRFSKEFGKSGRYCGLVLRERPNMGIAPGVPGAPEPDTLPERLNSWAYQEIVNILDRAYDSGEVPQAARGLIRRFYDNIVNAGLAVATRHGGRVAASTFDLNVDYRGGNYINKRLPANCDPVGGVALFGGYYLYLTTGGSGRVIYAKRAKE